VAVSDPDDVSAETRVDSVERLRQERDRLAEKLDILDKAVDAHRARIKETSERVAQMADAAQSVSAILVEALKRLESYEAIVAAAVRWLDTAASSVSEHVRAAAALRDVVKPEANRRKNQS
jgi:uncharacterized coiled-coil DUF342 family protein